MHVRIGWVLFLALLGGAAALLRSAKKDEADRSEGSAAEPEASARPESAAKPKAASPSEGPADLTKIEGIGPKINEILHAGGIRSHGELAKSSAGELRDILDRAGSRYRMHDPSTWPQQASLAAEDKWEELDRLKAELKSGRKV